MNNKWFPGQLMIKNEGIEMESLGNRKTVTLKVKNTDKRPVQVGSHFHFFETNRALDFDRQSAYGMRLCIPSGTSVRFEPDKTVEVTLIAISGERYCHGFNDLVNGYLDDDNVKRKSFETAKNNGFKGV
jgi:urease beta subunit